MNNMYQIKNLCQGKAIIIERKVLSQDGYFFKCSDCVHVPKSNENVIVTLIESSPYIYGRDLDKIIEIWNKAYKDNQVTRETETHKA